LSASVDEGRKRVLAILAEGESELQLNEKNAHVKIRKVGIPTDLNRDGRTPDVND
jgi:hypothetical protein